MVKMANFGVSLTTIKKKEKEIELCIICIGLELKNIFSLRFHLKNFLVKLNPKQGLAMVSCPREAVDSNKTMPLKI